MMTTREYRPIASLNQALPVTVTVAINFVQFDSRNPDMSMRAPFERVRIESTAFAGIPAWKVTAESSTNHWWQITLSKDDGAELAGLIAEARNL